MVYFDDCCNRVVMVFSSWHMLQSSRCDNVIRVVLVTSSGSTSRVVSLKTLCVERLINAKSEMALSPRVHMVQKLEESPRHLIDVQNYEFRCHSRCFLVER
ncbi:hypothetical protein TNCV_2594591 [Trichonephila clavipes]|nr:hypothetical protein TNCV_2594591 [Trichonephila clavipes]